MPGDVTSPTDLVGRRISSVEWRTGGLFITCDDGTWLDFDAGCAQGELMSDCYVGRGEPTAPVDGSQLPPSPGSGEAQ